MMRNKIIGCIMIPFGWCGFLFAQTISPTDCGTLSYMINASGEIQQDLFDGVGFSVGDDMYPRDAIYLALRHTQSSCCMYGHLSGSQCPGDLPVEFYESTNIYEQLIDIGIRRMDGIPELMYGQSSLIDPLALSWREWINKHGVDPQGNPPGLILSQFNKVFRGQEDDIIQKPSSIVGVDAYVDRCSQLYAHENIQSMLQQQCDITYCISNDIYQYASLLGSDVSKQIPHALYYACTDLIHRRIIDEYDTTTYIMAAQANLYSQVAQEQYLAQYFIDTRMVTLIEKITKQLSLLEIINAKYTQGTQVCN